MAKETKTHAGPRRVTITEEERQTIDNISIRMRAPMTPETARKLSDDLQQVAINALRITPEERRAVEPSDPAKRLYKAYFVRKVEEHAEAMVLAKSYGEARSHFSQMESDDLPWAKATSYVELDDVTEVPVKCPPPAES